MIKLKDLSEDNYSKLLIDNDAYAREVDVLVKTIQSKIQEVIIVENDALNRSMVASLQLPQEVRLPPIEITPFNGDLASYKTFEEKFLSLVGNKTHMENVTKFAYLLGYLKGPALKLVESLPTVNSSYQTALDILRKNYSDPKEISRDLSLKLLNLKKCKDNYDDIYNFHCELECLLGQISNIIPTMKESAWLIETILHEKLPSRVIELFQHISGSTYPDLDCIRNKFTDVLARYKTTWKPDVSAKPKSFQSSNSSNFSQNKKNDFSKSSEHTSVNVGNKSSALASFQATATTKPVTKKNCKFCSSELHHTSQCDKYATYNSRIKRCTELNLCTRCTGENHKKADCTMTLRRNCYLCNSDNHIATLCENLQTAQSKENKKSNANKTFNGHLSLSGIANGSSSNILLPTMTVKMKDGAGNYIPVRALLDSCSQRTFVTSSLIKQLGISSENTNEVISITSFVSNDSVSNLNLLLSNKQVAMSAVIVDKVGQTEITVPGLLNTIKELKKKHEIADKYITSDVINSVHLLIGADYFSLVASGIIKIGDGIALQTIDGLAPMGNLSQYHTEINKKD